MADWEIAVHISNQLYAHGKNDQDDHYYAQKRAKEYIEGAFLSTSYSCNVITPPECPDLGNENKGGEFTKEHPCSPYDYSFESPLDYYTEWLNCGKSYEADDLNILITDAPAKSGGATCGCGKYAHAQTGGGIVDELDPGYRRIGSNYGERAMETVLHELGHLMLEGRPTDEDGDKETHHDMGHIEKRSGNNTCTVMYVNGPYNNCEDYYGYSYEDWEMTWSGCAESYFKK